jgi:hypothetical protein
MRGSRNRICLGLAALGLSIVVAADANADVILQQYAPTSTTMAALSPLNGSNAYTNTWLGQNQSTTGQSVYLPGSGSQYSITSFNFYTATYGNGTSSPPTAYSNYAPSGTDLYVFGMNGNPSLTDYENNGGTGGAYKGSPTSLFGNSNPTTSNGASFLGKSSMASNNSYSFLGSGITLTAGNTYYFYLAYPSTPSLPPFSFDVADGTTFGNSPYTPYSTETTASPLNGDQRYRASSTGNYLGPNNSVALFSLMTAVPEPSRVAGLLGLGIMGTVGLCVARFAKRKAASR